MIRQPWALFHQPLRGCLLFPYAVLWQKFQTFPHPQQSRPRPTSLTAKTRLVIYSAPPEFQDHEKEYLKYEFTRQDYLRVAGDRPGDGYGRSGTGENDQAGAVAA